jgi:hypothetical protein
VASRLLVGSFFAPGHDKLVEAAVIVTTYGGVPEFLVSHGASVPREGMLAALLMPEQEWWESALMLHSTELGQSATRNSSLSASGRGGDLFVVDNSNAGRTGLCISKSGATRLLRRPPGAATHCAA